jgi:adenylate kinase family enzyme
MCSVCGLPRLGNSKATACSFCAGPLKRRKDDNPKLFDTRLEQYHDRTEPIIAKARKAGYTIKKVDGEKLPYQIHAKIRKAIGV